MKAITSPLETFLELTSNRTRKSTELHKMSLIDSNVGKVYRDFRCLSDCHEFN